MSWEKSLEGSWLAGKNLPAAGLAVTLTAIRMEKLQDRDQAEGIMQECYIGSFSDFELDWVINKTNRRFLNENCGITDTTVENFAPIPLTLIQNPTNLGVGIRPILRVVVPLETAGDVSNYSADELAPDGEPF